MAKDPGAPAASPPPAEAAGLGMVAEGFAKLCRAVGADSFHLYGIDSRGLRLRAVMDGFYPEMAEQTLVLPAVLPAKFAEEALVRQCIFYWANDMSGAALVSEWAERVECTAPGAGIALPLVDASGSRGIVIFTAKRVEADEDAVMEAHAGCHALFSLLPDMQPRREDDCLPAVSPRELQCLRLTANGMTSDDIARELGLSVHTANQYLANAVDKLDAANRVHAVAKALREGLIE